jgi:hypothetical protein
MLSFVTNRRSSGPVSRYRRTRADTSLPATRASRSCGDLVLTSGVRARAAGELAVDSNALTYKRTSWSAATNIDGANVLYAVWCASALFCAAVDGAGNALTYNGTSWSAATNIDGAHVLFGVSCASALFCAAVDLNGNPLTYKINQGITFTLSAPSNAQTGFHLTPPGREMSRSPLEPRHWVIPVTWTQSQGDRVRDFRSGQMDTRCDQALPGRPCQQRHHEPGSTGTASSL